MHLCEKKTFEIESKPAELAVFISCFTIGFTFYLRALRPAALHWKILLTQDQSYVSPPSLINPSIFTSLQLSSQSSKVHTFIYTRNTLKHHYPEREVLNNFNLTKTPKTVDR